MKLMSNLSLKAKLMIGFGAILIGIIASGIISVHSLQRVLETKNALDNALKVSIHMVQLRSDQNRGNALLLEALMDDDDALVLQHLESITAKMDDVENRVKTIQHQLEANPEALKEFEEITDEILALGTLLQQQIAMIKRGQTGEAYELYKGNGKPLHEQIIVHLLDLEEKLGIQANQLMEVSNIVANRTKYTLTLISLIIIIVNLVIIIRLFRMMTNITMDIKNGILVLGTSTSEIQTTVAEISTGATETNTAISETSTTIEEIRQTSTVASSKAGILMEKSQQAADVGEQGLESSQQMIFAMKKIEDQMKLISNTITKLTEQNRSIGEITSTVADIADQSNLLAVNAAIEAAKAGEHGRGFSVVAQEIRSLAEQSKKSTAQVKEILNEVQKSVNHTVEVIQQGSKTVDEGTRMVMDDRQVVELLITNINDTMEAAVQILSSSQQQMAGMDQIVPAMENIRHASEQNIAGIRQARDASQNLHELSENLNNIIVHYRL